MTTVIADNTVVAFLLGAQTLDQKTLTNSGNIGLANGSTLNVGNSTNTISTQTAASIFTGNGLTSGQALAVDTGSNGFTTGSGTGFSCASLCGTAGATFNSLDSLAGAVNVRSTGNFTGTLFALTADRTTAGTVLGISANSLTTGKAIDVQLGALYSGTGAINVKAESYTGTILNVTSNSSAGSVNQKLANISSGQIGGTLLNVSTTGAYASTLGVFAVTANSATNATIANVSATSLSNSAAKALSITTGTAGTGIFVNTQALYTGNLIELQANNSSKFSVTETGATTLAGTLTVRGASITGPLAGAFTIDNGNGAAVNIGTLTATSVSLGASTIPVNAVGNFSVGPLAGSTFSVAAATGITAISGTLTVQNTTQVGDTTVNHTRLSIQGGNGASVSPTLNAVGGAGLNVGISLVPQGTGRVAVTSNGLDVTGDIAATIKLTGGVVASANAIELSGSAGASPVTITAKSTPNLNVSIQVIPLGTGKLLGPDSTAFSIDSNGGNVINIGGTLGTTLNLGRATQVQALLGNVTIAGTLTGPAIAATVFTIDNGNGSAISIGGTTATTLNLGRSGQTQALLGNVTTGGTLKGPGSGIAFQIDNGSNASLDLGTLGTTTIVNIGRSGANTNILGNLVLTSVGHILTTTTLVPTVTSNTGTTCTILTNGTDTAGQLQVVTTTGLAANQIMCTIAFNVAYTSYGPVVIITPAEGNAAGLANTKAPYVSSSTTTAWTLKSNATSMAAATYIWNYIVLR